MLARGSGLSHEEEEALFYALTEIAIEKRDYCKERILSNIKFEMPKTFSTKNEYLSKLKELLDKESEAARLS